MKNILLALLLGSLTAAAQAEWTRVEHPSKEFALYVENDTISAPDSSSAKVWHLVDYAATQSLGGRPFLSIKARDEYDCDRGMRRDLMHLWHQDRMAESIMIKAAYKPGSWNVPTVGSVEETMMRMVCPKK